MVRLLNLLNWFRQSFTGRQCALRPSHSVQPRKHCRPQLEALEDRRLLAALASFSLVYTFPPKFPVAPLRETLTVTTAADPAGPSGTLSLRQAILEADAAPFGAAVAFAIPGAGPHKIQPTAPLPALTNSVYLQGDTQAGTIMATASTPATLEIVLDGSKLKGSNDGIDIQASNCLMAGMVIENFSEYLINVEGSNNLIENNFLGSVDPNDLGGYAGVLIGSGSNNQIGGTNAIQRNVIAENTEGVILDGTNNSVLGNSIGTDAIGTQARGNRFDGIYVGGSGNTIGSTAAGAGNLISANLHDGIDIGLNVPRTMVQGNLIGTDSTGARALGNGVNGVEMAGSFNTIGGTTPAAQNVISGNQGHGVQVDGMGATYNLIQGNLIGTTQAGDASLGNVQAGIAIVNTQGNTIGGTVPGSGNVISGNHGDGVQISGSGAYNNAVQDNFIGTNAAGIAHLGNGSNGVNLIQGANDNDIGYTSNNVSPSPTVLDAHNVIAWNGVDGVQIDSGYANTILFNQIHDNGHLGIGLDTPMANEGQAAPGLLSATLNTTNGHLAITVSVPNTPNSYFRIEFFANTSADGAGNWEGATFLGSVVVQTDQNGIALTSGSSIVNVFLNPQSPVLAGQHITATATAMQTQSGPGNTSAFSNSVLVV